MVLLMHATPIAQVIGVLVSTKAVLNAKIATENHKSKLDRQKSFKTLTKLENNSSKRTLQTTAKNYNYMHTWQGYLLKTLYALKASSTSDLNFFNFGALPNFLHYIIQNGIKTR